MLVDEILGVLKTRPWNVLLHADSSYLELAGIMSKLLLSHFETLVVTL